MNISSSAWKASAKCDRYEYHSLITAKEILNLILIHMNKGYYEYANFWGTFPCTASG